MDARRLRQDSEKVAWAGAERNAVKGCTGWTFTRGQYCPGAPSGDRSTQWRSRRAVPKRRRGVHFSPRRASAPRPGARKLGRGCRGCGYATQCAACAAVGRGVRYCCARRHPGHPATPPPRGRARAAGARTPRGGRHPLNGAGRRGRSRLRPPGGEPSRGEGGAHPCPPRQTGMYAAAGRGAARTCRDRGDINPHTPEVLAQARPQRRPEQAPGRAADRPLGLKA